MKGRWYLFIVFFMIINFCFCACSKAENRFYVKGILPDAAGKLIVLDGTENSNFNYKISKLSEPYRFIVDIDNAVLLGQKRSIKVNNDNIKDFRISQFSVSPDVVRLVFTVDSVELLKKINVSKNKNSIFINLEETNTAKITENPLYKDREPPIASDKKEETNITDTREITLTNNTDDKDSIIKTLQEKISHNIVLKNFKRDNNRVIISGLGIISLTEPITLENPKRIAFDIPGGVIDSKELLETITLKNGDLIRVGQFDDSTVRIVIESEKADSYKAIISPDMQSLLISPEKEVSFEEFPDNSSLSEVNDIQIIKNDENVTKVILIASKPIIHEIKHSKFPNELNIEIYNLKKPDLEKVNKLPRTGQFHGVLFEDLNKTVKGSKLSFPINKTTKVQTRLSIDGKMLEITFKDVAPEVQPVISISKNAPRVVIDAGHGGEDPGAMRDIYKEKNITLEITQRIKARLQQAGIEVVMTREGDETVSLKKRVEITNVSTPDLFVSVHVNSSESPSIKGIETYMYTSQSEKLAKSIHKEMLKNISACDGGIRTARFYVIRNTDVPAILEEIGYLSNSTERCDLLSERRKDATVKAICDGILNFLKNK